MWQELHRWYGEQDVIEPEQPRCPSCGAFLSWQPVTSKKKCVSADQENVYNDEGEIIQVNISNPVFEDVEIWTCKKCGNDWEVDDVYKR